MRMKYRQMERTMRDWCWEHDSAIVYSLIAFVLISAYLYGKVD
jgi:hypothetical protein